MSKEFWKAPAPASVRLIRFTSAKVYPGIVAGSYVLAVKGTKPYLSTPQPRIYIQRPDYWGMEVVGSLPEFGIPVTAPYAVSLPLDGILGKKGIEVISAKKKVKEKVP